jgi:hypothetical protein
MADEWQDISEDDGITLGPEEALAREIAKSKALKVERLQLKDQVERLTAHNQSLRDENEALKKLRQARSGALEDSPEEADIPPSDAPRRKGLFLPNRWAFILLAFNLTAIGILLFFLLQRPVP